MILMTMIATLAASPAPAAKVELEAEPAYSALMLDLRGAYSQHAEAVRRVLTTARTACGVDGVLFGVYPNDPDAVPAADLRWRLGYRMKDNTACASGELAGLTLELHPAETVAVIRTTLGDSKRDGLGLFGWLAGSGYVQSGPTRMEYVGDGGPATAVRIIMPVRQRPDAAE